MKSDVKYYLWLDTRKSLKDGTHPITLVVNYYGKRKFYRIGHSTTEKYYEKAMLAKKGEPFEDRQKWEDHLKKAKDIIEQLKVFSFDKFNRLFYAKGGNNLEGYFEDKISVLRKQGRIGTANLYKDAKTSLSKFKPDLNFEDIDPGLLENYQAWMETETDEHKSRSSTTIGMYLRCLRALYNEAIKNGRIKQDFYPFYEYTIPTCENKKRALNMSQLVALKSYQPMPHEEFYIDMWWFSFYAAGMNVKDVLKLKWSNIKDDRIVFIRQKTRRTQKKQRTISIQIDDYIESFIEKYGQPDNDYIFYLFNEEKDPIKRHDKGKQVNKMVNKCIRAAAATKGIKTDVTLYNARHSYASLLNEKNVPLSYIKEQLGHANIRTTEIYLDSITKEKEKEYRAHLKVS